MEPWWSPLDAEAAGRWLNGQVLAQERRPDRLLAVARERCWSLHLEPPSRASERLVRSVLRRHEEAFSAAVLARLDRLASQVTKRYLRARRPPVHA